MRKFYDIDKSLTVSADDAYKAIIDAYGITMDGKPEFFDYTLSDFDDKLRIRGPSFIVKLEDFRKVQDEVSNFVYDRRSGLVFCEFGIGDHYGFMTQLKMVIDGKDNPPSHFDSYQDNYVIDENGFFLSSQSWEITIGQDFVLTAQEKIVFKSYDFRRVSYLNKDKKNK